MINKGGGWQKSFMAPFSYMVRDRTYMVDQTEPEAGEPDHWPEHFGSEEGDNIRQRPKRAARSKHTNMMGVVPSKMLSEHPLESTWFPLRYCPSIRYRAHGEGRRSGTLFWSHVAIFVLPVTSTPSFMHPPHSQVKSL